MLSFLAESRVTYRDISADKKMMDIQTLDFIFPFFVLIYGALITVVLNIPKLEKIATEKFTVEIYNQLKAHRILALVCLFVGAFWSLQNIWAGSAPLFPF